MKNFMFLLIAFMTISGCSKKESTINIVKGGCTDPYALNYDPEAKENNGSCIIPFQGPKNASFEYVGWGDKYWIPAAFDDGEPTSNSSYCAFLVDKNATDGKNCYKLRLQNGYCDAAQIYQENVNLGYSKAVLLDYTETLTPNSKGLLELSFITSSGTMMIGSHAVSTNFQKDLKFILPALPKVSGKFVLEYKTYDSFYDGILLVDNIRVY